jgi:hypothetical protein
MRAGVVLLVLAGCNQILGIRGGVSGGPDGSAGAFAVVSTTPAAGAPAGDVEAPLTITFSRAVDAATITTATITLTHQPDGAAVAITPSASGDTATLALADPLDFLEPYRLTIGAAVADTGGATLGAPVAVDFTARDGVWTTAAPITPATAGDTIAGAHLAPAPDGVWVTWTERGATIDAYVARVALTGAWDPPQPLDSVSATTSSIDVPVAIVGSTGHALVKWGFQSGLNTATEARTFDPGTGWSDPPIALAGAKQASPPDPVVAVGPDGMIYIAYAGTTDPQPPTMTRVRDPGGVWAAAQTFDPTAGPVVMHAAGAGSAELVYGTSSGLSIAGYRSSDGTFPLASFVTYATGANQSIACVSAAQGDDGLLELAFQFQDAGQATVRGGTGGLAFSTTAADVGCPAGAVDPSGNFLMTWVQGAGASASIRARRYVANVGLAAEDRVDDPVKGASSLPQVVLDSAGRGVVVWAQTDGVTPMVRARRYRPGVGWGAAIDELGAATSPIEAIELAASPRGRALALIVRGDGVTLARYH